MNQIIAAQQSAGTAILEWVIYRPYSLQSEESEQRELESIGFDYATIELVQSYFDVSLWGHQWQVGNATAQFDVPEELIEEFRRLFAAGKEEFFEDGMESAFSRNLVALIEQYGDIAIEVLTELIVGEQVHPEVASEALRWIGRIENPLSQHQRRLLLERSLFHSSPQVRDGAALGLASMDDPRAIASLEKAIHGAEEQELVTLRQDLKQVLDQLLDTQLEITR